MNIMLIDDDEAIRDMLQDIIEDYELGTVVASLPSAANITTAKLIARHIDLLLIEQQAACARTMQAGEQHGQGRFARPRAAGHQDQARQAHQSRSFP